MYQSKHYQTEGQYNRLYNPNITKFCSLLYCLLGIPIYWAMPESLYKIEGSSEGSTWSTCINHPKAIQSKFVWSRYRTGFCTSEIFVGFFTAINLYSGQIPAIFLGENWSAKGLINGLTLSLSLYLQTGWCRISEPSLVRYHSGELVATLQKPHPKGR